MKAIRIVRCTALVAGLVLLAAPAAAGQACREEPVSPAEMRDGLAMAEQVQQALDASGADVALIARVGQDLGKYGLKYSHMGFVMREGEEGPWTVVHLLNECSGPRSSIYREGLGWFFLDKPFRYEAMLAVPSPEVAVRLREALLSDLGPQLKSERYNMLAYPFNPASQNSNQWALEMYAASQARDTPLRTHAAVMSWLALAGFKADVIHLNTAVRLGADFTRFNINFNDHPLDQRLAGNIATTTVASAMRFISRRDPAMKVTEMSLKENPDA